MKTYKEYATLIQKKTTRIHMQLNLIFFPKLSKEITILGKLKILQKNEMKKKNEEKK
jgi:hypothetical protein